MALWGRSMGACTALIYCSEHPETVSCMILDSPFKDLRKLIKEIAAERTKLPGLFFEPILSLVDNQLQGKIQHKFAQYKMKAYLSRVPSYVPMLFLVSRNDQLVKVHHG